MEVYPIIESIEGQKLYESFLVILDNRGCNKKCPYCTAQITNWPKGDDCFDKLESVLQSLDDNNIRFEYLTISGNGEPAFYSVETLKKLHTILERYNHLFQNKRFQTGGLLFLSKEKYSIFQDYIMEITRVSVDPREDMDILGYHPDYMSFDSFHKSIIGLNHCLLKDNFSTLVNDIKRYDLMMAGRIHSITLKTLNLNTKDGKIDNPCSQWIFQNGLLAQDSEKVVEVISGSFELVFNYDVKRDRYIWRLPSGAPLIFVTKKKRYGESHLVFNKGRLINYELEELKAGDL